MRRVLAVLVLVWATCQGQAVISPLPTPPIPVPPVEMSAMALPLNTTLVKCHPLTQKQDCGRSHVCKAGLCSYCVTDEDCREAVLVCSVNLDDPSRSRCVHAPLFPRFTARDTMVSLFLFMGGLLAAAGGMGGGVLFVPLLLLGGWSISEAIPLSEATIFGGAVAQSFQNTLKPHPKANRPLINYDTAFLLGPMAFMGTLLGVLFNTLFPEWLIVALLALLLGYSTRHTLRKGISTWRTEEVERLRGAGGVGGDTDPLLEPGTPRKHRGPPSADRAVNPLEIDEEPDLWEPGSLYQERLENAVEQEAKTPLGKVMLLALVWIVVPVLSLLRGGNGLQSVIGVRCGTANHWLLEISALPILFVGTLLVGKYLRATHALKASISFPFVEGDVHWTSRNTLVWPMLATGAGVTAGMMGTGGGACLTIIMLELGMLAETTAATSSFLIMMTALAAAFQFFVLGVLQLDYALWFAFLGFVSAFVGKALLGFLARRSRRTSIIFFSVLPILAVLMVFVGIVGIKDVLLKSRAHAKLGFNSLCPNQ